MSAKDFQRRPGRYQRLALAQPVTITSHGEPSLVVMSVREYQRLSGAGSASEAELQSRAAEASDAARAAVPARRKRSQAAPMNCARAIAILRRLRKALEARGIAHAGVFGSVARNDVKPTSDVDVVVTPERGRKLDLIDLGGVQSLLEEGFAGMNVDIVVEPIAQPELRQAVHEDRVSAF